MRRRPDRARRCDSVSELARVVRRGRGLQLEDSCRGGQAGATGRPAVRNATTRSDSQTFKTLIWSSTDKKMLWAPRLSEGSTQRIRSKTLENTLIRLLRLFWSYLDSCFYWLGPLGLDWIFPSTQSQKKVSETSVRIENVQSWRLSSSWIWCWFLFVGSCRAVWCFLTSSCQSMKPKSWDGTLKTKVYPQNIFEYRASWRLSLVSVIDTMEQCWMLMLNKHKVT